LLPFHETDSSLQVQIRPAKAYVVTENVWGQTLQVTLSELAVDVSIPLVYLIWVEKRSEQLVLGLEIDVEVWILYLAR